MKYPIKALSVVLLSLLACAAQASMIERGNSQHHDNDLNRGRLQDVNHAKTSNFDNDGSLPRTERVNFTDLGGQDEHGRAVDRDDSHHFFSNVQVSEHSSGHRGNHAPDHDFNWDLVTGRDDHSGHHNAFNDDEEFEAREFHCDDVGFTPVPAAVPLPAAFWLFATGLLALRSRKV
jgi:hypothetical protein